MKRCADCEYYAPVDGTPEFGECRINPPIVLERIMLDMRQTAPVKLNLGLGLSSTFEEGENNITMPPGVWPMVEQDEWCGDFSSQAGEL
jgi:hypothetical protein